MLIVTLWPLLINCTLFVVSFSEMVEAMKKVASLDVELTVEERNLLSVAYKNVIGARRASWRIISSIEQKEESKGGDEKLEMIRNYRAQVCFIGNTCAVVLSGIAHNSELLIVIRFICPSFRLRRNWKKSVLISWMFWISISSRMPVPGSPKFSTIKCNQSIRVPKK